MVHGDRFLTSKDGIVGDDTTSRERCVSLFCEYRQGILEPGCDVCSDLTPFYFTLRPLWTLLIDRHYCYSGCSSYRGRCVDGKWCFHGNSTSRTSSVMLIQCELFKSSVPPVFRSVLWRWYYFVVFGFCVIIITFFVSFFKSTEHNDFGSHCIRLFAPTLF